MSSSSARFICRQPLRPWDSLRLLVLILGAMPASSAFAQTSISARLERLTLEWNQRLDELASSASPDEAAAIRGLRHGTDGSRSYYYLPQIDHDSDEFRSTPLVPAVLKEAGREHAAALFELAEAARRENERSWAYRLAALTLRFDPAHRTAREWHGLDSSDTRRSPSFVVRRGRRRHARFGWPAGSYADVTTPHFQITSNAPAASIDALVETLETTRAIWKQAFFECWSPPQFLSSQDGIVFKPPQSRRRHRVVLFATKAEYLHWIRQIERRADVTRGFYHAPSLTTYFSADGDFPQSTWCHEATHQLFYERPGQRADLGGQDNFWLLEGVAMYMESLQSCGAWHTLGGLEAERLQYARFRALRQRWLMPLSEFTALDQQALQRHRDIRAIYSQAAGLTQFLMHARDGQFRDGLIDLLKEIDAGRRSRQPLPERWDLTWESWRSAYLEFLQVTDDDLQAFEPLATVRRLSFGGTDVSDRGLRHLPALDQLKWLDLADTRVTDAFANQLSDATQLEQLSFGQTAITDLTVARLAEATELKQLDLSGTQITDASLVVVGKLPALESLWLTQTSVTDAGIESLKALTRLQSLDLEGTSVSAEAAARLRANLPELTASGDDAISSPTSESKANGP